MDRFSIVQNEKVCIVCGSNRNIHCHEVFFGRNRKKSIEDGCCVYLCARHHNMSDEGVHFTKELDKSLKKIMQTAWCKYYHRTTEDFIERYGRNYL